MARSCICNSAGNTRRALSGGAREVSGGACEVSGGACEVSGGACEERQTSLAAPAGLRRPADRAVTVPEAGSPRLL